MVNDGSTDGAEAILDAYHDPEGERGLPLRVHHQPPLGLSAGRQWAVEHAKGEWVAITDIDVRPEPDWVANMVAHIQPVSEEERVVAITGRTVFEQANDLVSRLRSVEIAANIALAPVVPVSPTARVPCFTGKPCSTLVDLTRHGTTQRTWK